MPPKSATATAPTPPVEDAPTPDVKAPRKHLDPASVVITAVTPVEGGNPFARGSKDVPADHPVVKAFDLSWEKKTVLFLKSEQPEGLIKLLRKIAAQKDLGVRLNAKDGGVYFEVKVKRARKTKDTETE